MRQAFSAKIFKWLFNFVTLQQHILFYDDYLGGWNSVSVHFSPPSVHLWGFEQKNTCFNYCLGKYKGRQMVMFRYSDGRCKDRWWHSRRWVTMCAHPGLDGPHDHQCFIITTYNHNISCFAAIFTLRKYNCNILFYTIPLPSRGC